MTRSTRYANARIAAWIRYLAGKPVPELTPLREVPPDKLKGGPPCPKRSTS